MKIVIAGSASNQESVLKWINFWNSKENHLVTNFPKTILPNDFFSNYPNIHKKFYEDLAEADVLFVANEEKNGISGYIGAETFAELSWCVTEKLLHGKNIKIILAKLPSEKVSCFEEIQIWLRLGWIDEVLG